METTLLYKKKKKKESKSIFLGECNICRYFLGMVDISNIFGYRYIQYIFGIKARW